MENSARKLCGVFATTAGLLVASGAGLFAARILDQPYASTNYRATAVEFLSDPTSKALVDNCKAKVEKGEGCTATEVKLLQIESANKAAFSDAAFLYVPLGVTLAIGGLGVVAGSRKNKPAAPK